mgnify:CR=1 FL=1
MATITEELLKVAPLKKPPNAPVKNFGERVFWFFGGFKMLVCGAMKDNCTEFVPAVPLLCLLLHVLNPTNLLEILRCLSCGLWLQLAMESAFACPVSSDTSSGLNLSRRR